MNAEISVAAEQDFRAEVWPACFVRDYCVEHYGITPPAWYYHVGRLPAPSVEMGGRSWYTSQEFDAVRNYFAALPHHHNRGRKRATAKN